MAGRKQDEFPPRRSPRSVLSLQRRNTAASLQMPWGRVAQAVFRPCGWAQGAPAHALCHSEKHPLKAPSLHQTLPGVRHHGAHRRDAGCPLNSGQPRSGAQGRALPAPGRSRRPLSRPAPAFERVSAASRRLPSLPVRRVGLPLHRALRAPRSSRGWGDSEGPQMPRAPLEISFPPPCLMSAFGSGRAPSVLGCSGCCTQCHSWSSETGLICHGKLQAETEAPRGQAGPRPGFRPPLCCPALARWKEEGVLSPPAPVRAQTPAQGSPS